MYKSETLYFDDISEAYISFRKNGNRSVCLTGRRWETDIVGDRQYCERVEVYLHSETRSAEDIKDEAWFIPDGMFFIAEILVTNELFQAVAANLGGINDGRVNFSGSLDLDDAVDELMHQKEFERKNIIEWHFSFVAKKG
jgi:hypothetical protein